jgi:hypothetical protein
MKRPHTATKNVTGGVVILKSVLFTLLHNVFILLPINIHDINKRSAEINRNLTKKGGM